MTQRAWMWRRTGRMAGALATACLTILAAPPAGRAPVSAQTADYLMVKVGNEAATPTLAAEFLEELSSWLGERVPAFRGRTVRGWIANREKEALRILRERSPTLVFASPGFYLGHLRDGGPPAELVAQIPRFGSSTVHYYLVAPAGGPSSPAELQGRAIWTSFDFDVPYLSRAVFPDGFQPDRDFHLEPAENMADATFFLLEGGAGAPAALLLDEDLKQFFEEDDLVWPELRVVWTSSALPPEYVIALGEWGDPELEGVREALLAMGNTAEGRALLDLMDSSGLEPVDRELLERVRRRYDEVP